MQEQKINIDPNKLEDYVCDCGGKMFNQRFKLKVVPPLMAGNAKAVFINFPVVTCCACGKEVEPE